MHFLTPDECRQWASPNGVAYDAEGLPERLPAALGHVRFLLPTIPQVTSLCQYLSKCLEPRHECLLWVTLTDVWPSSENWHLYYRLRQSYGDGRQLHEAPGHLFLDYEVPEFCTFVQVGVLCGWDMFLLPRLSYGGPGTAQAFISHDEWIRLSHRDSRTVHEWHEELRQREYKLLDVGAA
jgi:hypothetical protein